MRSRAGSRHESRQLFVRDAAHPRGEGLSGYMNTLAAEVLPDAVSRFLAICGAPHYHRSPSKQATGGKQACLLRLVCLPIDLDSAAARLQTPLRQLSGRHAAAGQQNRVKALRQVVELLACLDRLVRAQLDP